MVRKNSDQSQVHCLVVIDLRAQVRYVDHDSYHPKQPQREFEGREDIVCQVCDNDIGSHHTNYQREQHDILIFKDMTVRGRDPKVNGEAVGGDWI
jgi:hypothetical protein